MKPYKLFRLNSSNGSRSISTTSNRLKINFNAPTTTTSLLNQRQSNEDQSQNPLKLINANTNPFPQVNSRISKLPQLKTKRLNPLIKKKIRFLENNFKRTTKATATGFMRNRSQGQRNENSNLSLDHSNQPSSVAKNSPHNQLRRMVQKPFKRSNNNQFSIVAPTMKKISQMLNSKKQQATVDKDKGKEIESRNEQTVIFPNESINEYQPRTRPIKKTTPITQREIIAHNSVAQLAIQQNVLKVYRGKSKAGKNENNMSKVNQDSFLMMTSLYNMVDFNVFGVFDGHGLNGHLVSDFIKEYFKQVLLRHKDLSSLSSIEEIHSKLIENNYQLIHSLFKAAESNLFKETFESHYSGTTAVILFQVGFHLICANVGDSRAILIEDHDSNSQMYQVRPLSFDQKPHHSNEKKRIEKSGGKVEQYSGKETINFLMLLELGIKAGPYRVWFKREEYPGLSMSRSIGDLIASTIGVISVPDIVECEITSSSHYIILASDGVWEFIDNEKALDVTKLFYQNNNAEGLCSNLIHQAISAWEKEDNVIDDITVVTLFF